MTAKPVITHHDARSARSILDELVSIYLEVYADSGPFYSEERYRQQINGHLSSPGFSMVTASLDAELVGYLYGFVVPAHTRSWQGLQTPLPADVTSEDGSRTFALCELMVRAPWRRRGIARALHDHLLDGRPERRARLLALPDNAPAQAAYASWGWHKIAELRPAWEHAPLYDVLVLELPSADRGSTQGEDVQESDERP